MRPFLVLLMTVGCLGLGGAATACRFWGLVGDGYPQGLIADQLRDGDPVTLRDLSHTNRDGWGIGFTHPDDDPHPLAGPVIRRRGSPAEDPGLPDYGVAVDELELLRPHTAIAHVRKCTISHCGVPDPHPFLRDGVLFAHNGRMSDSLMVELLTRDDPDFLVENPLDYDSTYIDSELYLLYLLKYHRQHPQQSRADALRHAVFDLAMLTSTRLNFVLAAGDTLFALRHAPNDESDPVRIYPGLGASPYWIAASQVLGSDPAGWVVLPPRTLAVLVPGQAARFLPVTADPTGEVIETGREKAIGRGAPNPSRGTVSIPLTQPPVDASVTLEVLDAQGRIVWRDRVERLPAGMRELTWDGCGLDGQAVASGTYWCRVRIGGESREQRVVILR
jgi:predicted glutamine amidotransferase